MNPYWDVYGHSNGRFYRMTPQGGRIAEMHVANICCVKAQRAGMAVARQRPTALPKLPYGGFPICQDRGLHGAKQSYIAIRRRRKRPANSYDDLLRKCTLTISYFISDVFTFRGKNIRISL